VLIGKYTSYIENNLYNKPNLISNVILIFWSTYTKICWLWIWVADVQTETTGNFYFFLLCLVWKCRGFYIYLIINNNVIYLISTYIQLQLTFPTGGNHRCLYSSCMYSSINKPTIMSKNSLSAPRRKPKYL
jgi:hypothetical protein